MVKVDAKITGFGLAELATLGRTREESGYDGLWSSESGHDPFLPLVPIAEHTDRIEIGTAIAVAFARNPMSMAYSAHDLQTLSKGRFILGLGSQVRPHIERRFGMPWGHPAPRMREYILALRAIWSAWDDGIPLDFRGEYYSHTLMTPFFAPEPNPTGAPKVHLAAVGEHMTEVAGEVADGLHPHPFTTERYLRERTLPTLQRGLDKAGRALSDFSISLLGLVASGRTQEEFAEAITGVRKQIAFYGSTPAYRAVLELHGWGELSTELNRLSRAGAWQEMGELIDDEVLHAFAVVAEPDQLGQAILDRFGDILDRFTFYAPYPHDEALWQSAARTLQGR